MYYPHFRVPYIPLHRNFSEYLDRKTGSRISVWNTQDFFNDQVRDVWNLGLSETWTAVIIAVTTSLSMLLLAEIAFRIVVRVRAGKVKKHSIYKYALMKYYSNPLSWLSMLATRSLVGKVTRQAGVPKFKATIAERTFPVWKSMLIRAIALLLVLCEIGLLFLATNQNVPYPIDVRAVPTFEIQDKGFDYAMPPVDQGCLTEPLTTKPGFKSIASVHMCDSFDLETLQPNHIQMRPPHAVIMVLSGLQGLSIQIVYGQQQVFSNPHISISIRNGTHYRTRFYSTSFQIREAMKSLFDRHKIPVTFHSDDDARFSRGAVFVVSAIVNVKTVDNGKEDVLLHLRGMIYALIQTTGRQRATFPTSLINETGVSYLDQVTDPFVINQRPWIGVLPSIIISAAMLLVVLVLNLFGFEGNVDNRWAWKEFFSDTHTIHDFNKGENEERALQWSIDDDGEGRIGFISYGGVVQNQNSVAQ